MVKAMRGVGRVTHDELEPCAVSVGALRAPYWRFTVGRLFTR